jgi:1-acyl-sn-glycerol-3-phosphate acyltransferase
MVLYSLIRIYCTHALKFYFREWEVKGIENIPSGAVIFAPNHQNAFLDAVLVTCSSNRNPFFLARADVFKKKITGKILHQLRLLPVYRFRDGFSAMKSNQAAFEKCREILSANEALVIFPEGNHGSEYRLRPLQKGIARIVCGADATNKIAVVPVGIHYESHHLFRSRVLVHFGEPVYNVMSDAEPDPVQLLTDRICEKLKPLILDIPQENYAEQFSQLLIYRPRFSPISKQLQFEQQLVSNAGKLPEHPFPSLKKQPLPGRINNILARLLLAVPSFLLHHFVINRLSDPQFTASVKFAAGMLMVPLWLLLLALVLLAMTGSYPVMIAFLSAAFFILFYDRK